MRKSLPSGKNVALARLSSPILITITDFPRYPYHFVDFVYIHYPHLCSFVFVILCIHTFTTDPGENYAPSRDRLGKDNHAKRENYEGKPRRKHEISQNALQMCANHSILPWMDLRPNCGSQKVTVLTLSVLALTTGVGVENPSRLC